MFRGDQSHVSLSRSIGKNLLEQYSKKSSLFSIYENTSGSSGWNVEQNMTFSSVYWKISGRNGTFEKEITFSSRAKLNGNLCSIYSLVPFLPVASLWTFTASHLEENGGCFAKSSNGTKSFRTEIPTRNSEKLFVNGKQPEPLRDVCISKRPP